MRVRKIPGNPDRYQKQTNGVWRDISQAEFDRLCPSKALRLDRGEVPWTHGDHGDWSSENGGRGRYFGMVARQPGGKDPGAYCRTAADLIQRAKDRPELGLSLQRDRTY